MSAQYEVSILLQEMDYDLFSPQSYMSLMKKDTVTGLELRDPLVVKEGIIILLSKRYRDLEGSSPKTLFVGHNVDLESNAVDYIKRCDLNVVRLPYQEFTNFVFVKTVGCINIPNIGWACYDCRSIFLNLNEEDYMKTLLDVERRCPNCHDS